MDRTLTEASVNDNLITELEFTAALSGLSKDTPPGPDKVKYSDIKNLSVDNKSELFRLYEGSFVTGQIPEDWSHSYLKPIPRSGKDRILMVQNTTEKLMERILGQEACSGLGKEKRTSPKPRRAQNRKIHLGKRSQIRTQCLRRISEEGTNSGRGDRCGRCVQQSAIQTIDGTPCAIWRQLDALEMARSSTPGKKGSHATWKLDFQGPTTDNGTSTRVPLSPVPYNVYTRGLTDLNSNSLSRVLMLASNGFIYKTASDNHTAITAVQGQLDKLSQWYQKTESDINQSKVQTLWCTLNNKAAGRTMPSVSFNEEAIERTNSLR